MRLLPVDYAVRNLGRSPVRLAGVLAGNTLVVLLMIAAASFVAGMRESLTIRHAANNVILLATGSEESIERSQIPATTPGVVAASVAGLKSRAGVAFVSPEIVSAVIMRTEANAPGELRAVLRGVTPGAFLVHGRVEIIDGRAPVAGRHELLVGQLAGDKFGLPRERLAIGRTLWFDGRDWTIVGHMRARGSVIDAELWTPLADLQLAMKRDSLSCVVVTLDTAEFADLDAFAKTRVDLEIAAIPEATYYAQLLQFFRPVRIMVWITAGLIAMAGVLGGLNTLYAAVVARVREFAMLQSLGFSRRAIAVSLLQESLLAAAVSVLLALGLAMILLDGAAVTFSMGVFQLAVDDGVVAVAAATGVLLAVVGPIAPALRCLRLPIPEALKSV